MSEVIWFKKDIKVSDMDFVFSKNMLSNLNITCTQLGADSITLRMPVEEKHAQPYNLLHGGASCVLAESAGSIASNLLINPKEFITLGLEINATHVRSVEIGDSVEAFCKPVKLGRTIQVWDIVISRVSDQKIVCKSRLTTLTKRKQTT